MQPPRTTFLNIMSVRYRSVIFGVLAFTLGLVLIIFKSWLIELMTSYVIVLKPNSIIEGLWKKSPMEIPLNIYIFNWTNSHEFGNLNTKPKFEEVGPYKFKHIMEKINVVYNNNDTVTFNQIRIFDYWDNNTNSDLFDQIITLNAFSMFSSHHFRDSNYFLKRGISVFLSTVYPDIHIKTTAKQLLLEGYNDILVDVVYYAPFLAEDIPRFHKFGWVYIMNGTSIFDGVFNMQTGVNGKFDVLQWNYNKTVSSFNGNCAKVQGTLGELYSTRVSRTSTSIFIPLMCREMQFDYEEDVEVNGILGYKFSVGDSLLDNGTKIPENKCYCAGDCVPSGIFNVSSCRYGVPAFVSLPNFYLADPIYKNAVEGLNPVKEKHQAYIIVEPTTGLPLKVVIRIQLNIYVRPVKNILLFENVPEIVFPVLWAELDTEMPKSFITLLRFYLLIPYVLIGIGIVGIIIGIKILLSVAYKPTLIALQKRFHKRTACAPAKFEEIILKGERKAS